MSSNIYCCDVNSIIKSENITQSVVEENKIEANGGNYLAELYTIQIKGKKNGNNEEINLFVKKQISVENDAISINEAYNREIFVYKTLLKQYDKLQDEANISPKERFKCAKFYDTNDENTIIMENLQKNGFEVYNRFKSITIEYAELVLDQLAKMHALSFVMESKMSAQFNKIKERIESIEESPIKFTETAFDFFRKQCQSAINVLDSEDAKARLSKVIFEKIYDLPNFRNGKSSKTKCICHGDFRVNNIMHKYDNDGNISEIIPLDYQLVYYGSPLNDFFYFILPGSDKSFRAKHMLHLKEFYYKRLSKFLNNFDLDVNDIYPKNIFNEDYETLIVDTGLTYTLMIEAFVLAPEDDFPDLSNTSFEDIEPVTTELYKERVNELIEDFIDWGYL